MIFSQPSVLSSKPKTVRAEDGFTLMELLVAISLMGIISAIAIPAISSLRQSADLRSAAADLSGDLKMARLLAVTKNRQVVVTLRDADPYGYDIVYTEDGVDVERNINLADLGTGVSLSKNGVGDTLSFKSSGSMGGARTICLTSVSGQTQGLTLNNIGRAYEAPCP